MNSERSLDKTLVRRAFDRAATGYDAAAALQREIADRMLARLDYLKHRPAVVLDAGSGTGYAGAGLRSRYRDAVLVELDLALGMLQRSAQRDGWWARGLAALGGARVQRVCGEIEQLPLASGTIGMIWSNLALQWVEDLPAAFAEMWRVLRPGGVLFFSTFGPDTLKELRAAFAQADTHAHVNRFIDMHDIGDLLVRARFADPVMDMEVLTVTYDSPRALMRELKAIGAHNVNRARPQGLTGREAIARVEAAYESLRRDGRIPATFEVVYGHAWKPETPRVAADGRAIVRFERGGR